jgi:hypothetical protein
MTSPLFIIIMIGVISLVALETVWYWHRGTRGTWKEWPAGRSLMYLLLIIGVGFGYGVVNQLLGQYAIRPFIGTALYLAFIGALLIIRLTIRAEMRRGQRTPLKTVLPTTTGPIDITVATKNEESSHD